MAKKDRYEQLQRKLELLATEKGESLTQGIIDPSERNRDVQMYKAFFFANDSKKLRKTISQLRKYSLPLDDSLLEWKHKTFEPLVRQLSELGREVSASTGKPVETESVSVSNWISRLIPGEVVEDDYIIQENFGMWTLHRLEEEDNVIDVDATSPPPPPVVGTNGSWTDDAVAEETANNVRELARVRAQRSEHAIGEKLRLLLTAVGDTSTLTPNECRELGERFSRAIGVKGSVESKTQPPSRTGKPDSGKPKRDAKKKAESKNSAIKAAFKKIQEEKQRTGKDLPPDHPFVQAWMALRNLREPDADSAKAVQRPKGQSDSFRGQPPKAASTSESY
jgi:hypothetical protein